MRLGISASIAYAAANPSSRYYSPLRAQIMSDAESVAGHAAEPIADIATSSVQPMHGRRSLTGPTLALTPRRVLYKEPCEPSGMFVAILLTEPFGPNRIAEVAYHRGSNWVIDQSAHYGPGQFGGWWEIEGTVSG